MIFFIYDSDYFSFASYSASRLICPASDLYLAAALETETPFAWDSFCDEYRGFIRSVARKFTMNDEDADDVAQDLCISIVPRIKRFTGRGSLRGWLCAVTPNLARDKYRVGANRFETSLDARLDGENPEDTRINPKLATDSGVGADITRNSLDQVSCAEMFEKTLADALEQLDPSQQELLNYKFFKGLKGREIAQIRGVKEYVISKHLKKHLACLRKRILQLATTTCGFTIREVKECLGLLTG